MRLPASKMVGSAPRFRRASAQSVPGEGEKAPGPGKTLQSRHLCAGEVLSEVHQKGFDSGPCSSSQRQLRRRPRQPPGARPSRRPPDAGQPWLPHWGGLSRDGRPEARKHREHCQGAARVTRVQVIRDTLRHVTCFALHQVTTADCA